MKSALLFRLGGLGDLLAAFPSIYFLRKKFPALSLTLVGRKEYALLFKEVGVVNQVIPGSDARFMNLFQNAALAEAEFTEWISSFGLVLGWMQKKKSRELENYFLSTGVENCRLFVYDSSERFPIQRCFFEKTQEFLNQFPGQNPGFVDCCRLPLMPENKRRKRELFAGKEVPIGKRFAVIHPGSGSQDKCWPLENFLTIVNRLSQAGLSGILVTGEAEQRMHNKIKKISFPQNWNWLDNPSLLELAALLEEAFLYLGNDSGVTHLAALCGTRVVALFRREFEFTWKPCGEPSILSADNPSQISADSVWKTVSGLL